MSGATTSVTRATHLSPPSTMGPVRTTRAAPTIHGLIETTVAPRTCARELVCTMTTVTPTLTMHMTANTAPQVRERRPFLM